MIVYYTDKYEGGRDESHRLLEKALAVHTGDEEQAKALTEALKKGEHGKPYIEGFSCFSISHTGSIWAVLVADRECGLDLQLSRKCNYAAISRRFFAPHDAEAIASLIADESEFDDKNDTFFHIWARREALVKALGGTVYDPDLPAVSGDCVDIEGKRYVIRNIQLPDMPQVYAAVCLKYYDSDLQIPLSVPHIEWRELQNA